MLNGDFGTEVRQERVGGLSAEFDSFSGAYIDGTPGEFALTELAYGMAEIIAGARYEYAVQVQAEPDGMWHMVTSWQDDPRPIQPEGRDLEANERIVRRLVTDVEVIE